MAEVIERPEEDLVGYCGNPLCGDPIFVGDKYDLHYGTEWCQPCIDNDDMEASDG